MATLLRFLRSLAARLKPHAWDITLAIFVAGYAVTIQLLRLEPVEIGGDALNKWHFARQWFHDFDVTRVNWNHHLSRFGVNVPLAVIQLLFGRGALNYYLASVGVFAGVAVLTFVIGRLAHGRATGLLACLWFVRFPGWIRAGSQVSPDAFGALYVAYAMLFLLLYERSTRKKMLWLCASSACTALAYLAKEPFAAFVGGGIVATFLISRSYRDAAIYAAIPLGVLGLETLFYQLVSPYSSRFGLVSSTHGSAVIRSIFHVFRRYTTLPRAWTPLLVSALVAVFALPFLLRSRRIWPLIWLPLSFFAFYTFAIKSLHPLAMWARFLPRYLDAGVPFLALLGACLIVSVVALLLRMLFGLLSRWGVGAAAVARVRSLARVGPAAACVLLLLLAARAYARRPPTSRHPLVVTAKLERVLTDAYRRRLPIVSSRGRVFGRGLALKAAYKFYIDDRLLVEDGRLPDWRGAASIGYRLVRAGGPNPKRGCNVQIWAAGRFLRYQTLTPLPKKCDESSTGKDDDGAIPPGLPLPAPDGLDEIELDDETDTELDDETETELGDETDTEREHSRPPE
jgi:hypothetical protein